jgi:hypothetical protein
MADTETAFKNGIITFLGGLIEPTSEIAKPVTPVAGAVSPAGVNSNGTPIVNSNLQPQAVNPLIWVGVGLVALLFLVLVVTLFKGK